MSPRPDTLDGHEGPSLREELGKRHGFDSLEQRVHLALLRTGSLSEQPLHAVFRAHGLSMSTYNILRILRGSGEAGRRAMDIAPGMVVRVPDVTRLLDRLEREGFIERGSDPTDLRRVVVTITDAGKAKLSEVEAEVMAAHDAVLGTLDEADLRSLDALLSRVRAAMERAGEADEG